MCRCQPRATALLMRLLVHILDEGDVRFDRRLQGSAHIFRAKHGFKVHAGRGEERARRFPLCQRSTDKAQQRTSGARIITSLLIASATPSISARTSAGESVVSSERVRS